MTNRRGAAVERFVQSLLDEGELGEIDLCYSQRSGATWSLRSTAEQPLTSQASFPESEGPRFLVASLTKPVVAAAVLRLVVSGECTLADRVSDLLPSWRGDRRRGVTLRHLLTHTAGLPEVWDDNIDLRARHASLHDFVDASYRQSLETRPGAITRYSSVGFSLLGAIVEMLSGQSLSAFVQAEVFDRCQMTASSLGEFATGSTVSTSRIVDVALPSWQLGTNWHWNTDYWRRLGAPWGGIISTASDMMRFLRSSAGWDRVDLLPAPVRRVAESSQLTDAGVSEMSSLRKPWGLGWRWNWPGHSAALCELLPADTVGHYGATGSVMWRTGSEALVILTSNSIDKRPRLLQRISNVIVSEFSG